MGREGAVVRSLDPDPDFARHAFAGQPILRGNCLDHAVAAPGQPLGKAGDHEADPVGKKLVGLLRPIGPCGGGIAGRQLACGEPAECDPCPNQPDEGLDGQAQHPAGIAQAQRPAGLTKRLKNEPERNDQLRVCRVWSGCSCWCLGRRWVASPCSADEVARHCAGRARRSVWWQRVSMSQLLLSVRPRAPARCFSGRRLGMVWLRPDAGLRCRRMAAQGLARNALRKAFLRAASRSAGAPDGPDYRGCCRGRRPDYVLRDDIRERQAQCRPYHRLGVFGGGDPSGSVSSDFAAFHR